MFYVIYKITNQINGKFYIGSHKTKDLNDNYMGSGKYLIKAQQKYGIENFKREILFVFDTPEEMYAKEAEIVNEEFLITENTYNLKVGGFGGWDFNNTQYGQTLRKHSYEAWRKAGTEVFLEKYYTCDDFKNKHLEHLDNVRKDAISTIKEKYPRGTFYGKNHSDQTKKLIGEANSIKQRGNKNSQFGTMWITNGVSSKKIKKSDVIPIGWHSGRVIKST